VVAVVRPRIFRRRFGDATRPEPAGARRSQKLAVVLSDTKCLRGSIKNKDAKVAYSYDV